MEKLNYTPRGDRVIVKRLAAPQSKQGDLALPDSQKEPPHEGIVVAVGPGNRNRVTGYIDELDLKVGDHVCFLEHAGYEVPVDGETYLQLRDEEIVGSRPLPARTDGGWGSLGEPVEADRELNANGGAITSAIIANALSMAGLLGQTHFTPDEYVWKLHPLQREGAVYGIIAAMTRLSWDAAAVTMGKIPLDVSMKYPQATIELWRGEERLVVISNLAVPTALDEETNVEANCIR